MTADKTSLSYGCWPSKISARDVAHGSLRFGHMDVDGYSLYWTEGRPREDGRSVVVRLRALLSGDEAQDILNTPYSARSVVHEYGGGEFTAMNDIVFFVNASDQDIYIARGGEISRLTEAPDTRFGDFTVDRARGRLIAVGEKHEAESGSGPRNFLCAIPLGGEARGKVIPIREGADFYASPRLSADSRRLAWIEWDLPGMPWESSRLMVSELSSVGAMSQPAHVEGGRGTAVFQPQWGGDGPLFFISDRSGWGNLYCWTGKEIYPVCRRDAEFAVPLWALGTRTYAPLTDGRIFATFVEGGAVRAGIIPGPGAWLETLELPYRDIRNPCAISANIFAIATTDDMASSIVRIRLDEEGQSLGPSVIRRSAEAKIDPEDVSRAEFMTAKRDDGPDVHALFYPPLNASHKGPEDELPPLIVSAHGGPTGMADRGLKLKIQYWTSRGFAFLDVDYRGSWGYGREYRRALNGQWGVGDVEDVIAAAGAAAARGRVDGERLLISGSSAGGFTVLCALAFHDVFKAGCSYYGIGNLGQLLKHTHKFESGYIYALTGTKPNQTARVFQARSPYHHAGEIKAPVFFFQGGQDVVVPPEQSREMVEALKSNGVPVGYMEFESEGHGFRRGETIVKALETEYAFYARVLKLKPEEKLPRVELFNEEALS